MSITFGALLLVPLLWVNGSSQVHRFTNGIILCPYFNVGRYQAHLRRSCQVYRKRRDTMLLALNRHLPAGVRVDPPQGGLFIWLRLPGSLSSEKLLPLAREEGVTFAPGSGFFPDDSGDKRCLRLNFAAQPPDAIEEGMKRLGRAIMRLTSTCGARKTVIWPLMPLRPRKCSLAFPFGCSGTHENQSQW